MFTSASVCDVLPCLLFVQIVWLSFLYAYVQYSVVYGRCVLGHLHIFAANTEHPTINDYSEEIEFASAVRLILACCKL